MHRRTALCRSLLRSFRQVPEHVRAETAALQALQPARRRLVPPRHGQVLLQQSVIGKGSKALLAMNQPGGFVPQLRVPRCRRTQKLEFCENGAKALAWEATQFRAGRELFARYTVTELMAQTDYWLEMQGRLTEPMRYDAATDHYVPCSWDDAFALIGRHLQALDSPHQAEFYTSGRTPNEAAFLYSIFVREFGTNNFPDCSNMCHEPTSRGLPPAIGVEQGHHRAAGFRACRGDLRDRPEHRYQFTADDEQPGRGA